MLDDFIKDLIDRFDDMSPDELDAIYKAMRERAMEIGEEWLDSLDFEDDDGYSK